MQIDLEVTIDPAGAAITVAELEARLPALRVTLAEALERTDPRFVGHIRAEGDVEDAQREVARHLATLRRVSAEFPELEVTIIAPPDGDVLRLQRGTFGEDEAEISQLLGAIRGDRRWRLYASFRIADKQPLLEAVETAVALTYVTTVDESVSSIAFGFELEGEAVCVGDLLALLRMAWRQEGSGCETLVEVEGDTPVVVTLRTGLDWRELEQQFRPEASTSTIRELTELPELAHVVGSHGLTWIDEDEQIFGIVHRVLCALSERRESEGLPVEVRLHAGGAVSFTSQGKVVERPRAPSHVERRLHATWSGGALFSETEGTAERARSTLITATRGSFDEGPRFTHVRGIDGDASNTYVIADGPDGVTLFCLDAMRLRHREERRWPRDEVPTDVAVVGKHRLAVTVDQGTRSAVHLIERADADFGRKLALPCVAPQIVGHGHGALWITGMAPTPGLVRCDLFRVELASGAVTIMTAELDVPTIDVVVHEHAAFALLATPGAVYRTGESGLREVLEIASDERVTGMAFDRSTAVFVDGPRGARLIFGGSRQVVPLQAPGYAPRFV